MTNGPTTIVLVDCPHCKGKGEFEYLARENGKIVVSKYKCAVCDGKGKIAQNGSKPSRPGISSEVDVFLILILVILVGFFLLLATGK